MKRTQQDFFHLPSVTFRSLFGSLALFLLSINALTAVITIWTDGDYLGKIFWSSLNLFIAVTVAYFLIEKVLTNKGVVPTSLSLLLVACMFLLSEYAILSSHVSIIAVYLGYIAYIVAIAFNVLISLFYRSSKTMEKTGIIAMVLAFFAANSFVYSIMLVDNASADFADKLTATFLSLTMFSLIALPIVRLLERKAKL